MKMPSTAYRSEDIIGRLISRDAVIKLKALREVKNQIIGNRTKKLSFLKLGAVPCIVSALASDSDSSILVQSAAAIGSFACGFEEGVRAVLDGGAFPHLLRLISHSEEKVVNAGARSLKMLYQSKLTPKYDFLQEKNMKFLLSLLHRENENVTGLGASIITHSCQTSLEQTTLCEAGVLKKLIRLLDGTLSQRNASLEAMATIVKNSPEAVSKYLGPKSGRTLSTIIDLTNDKCSRSSLLACICLIAIRNASPCHLQDIELKSKLVVRILELLDDSDQVGDEASFALSHLIREKEDFQKLASEVDAIDKLCNHLKKCHLPVKRLLGILLALADLCSQLESCRCRLLSLQVLNIITDALTHDHAQVRCAACNCLRSLSRSVKNLSVGLFMDDMVVSPLIRLLSDSSREVQIAALGAVSNIVVNFGTRNTTFLQCGGLKHLVELSKSMDSTVRGNAVWALRNLMFLADNSCKEEILSELTASSLVSLVHDPEPFVQEQALALIRNLVDGVSISLDYVFAENGIILNAVGKQLRNASKVEVQIQGMYVLSNVATGNSFFKDAVMEQLLPEENNDIPSILIKFLQSVDNRLRTAAIWTVLNLTFPATRDALDRLTRLRNAGIIPQIKNMSNDSCMEVKLRVRSVLTKSMTLGDGFI